jgi:perosamine synthetase
MDFMAERDKTVRLGAGCDPCDAGVKECGCGQVGGLSERRASDVAEAIISVCQRPQKLHSPQIGEGELRVTTEAVRHGDVTHGPHVEAFERGISDIVGGGEVVAVSSGTAALHLALLSLGVGPGDAVVVPAFTFVATANAVRYCGATPHFVDCDEYGSLSPEALDAWLLNNSCKAVVCVHCFGHLCDMPALAAVCEKHGVYLVEDAAQALGTEGVAKHGIVATFSFNGNKIVTTGGGGAVVTHDVTLRNRVRKLANVSKVDVPNAFWHTDVGFNYRMPNINAAIGVAQLSALSGIIAKKKALHDAYEAAGLTLLGTPRPSNHWLNAVVVGDDIRHRVVEKLSAGGIECRLSWTPLNYFHMYRKNPRDELNNTMELAISIVNVPSGPGVIR